MNLSDYHKKWKSILPKKLSERVSYIHYEIIMPRIKKNNKYRNVVQKNKKSNNGIINQIQYIENYLDDLVEFDINKIITYVETAYAFWLLDINNKEEYLKNRIDEFFKGSTYYEDGEAGFRQFEYEIHTIARFIEESIYIEDIEDKENAGYPDLLLKANKLRAPIEIKMPMSNIERGIKKAKSQIYSYHNKYSGCIIIGLDFIDDIEGKDNNDIIEYLISEYYSLVKKSEIICFFENWNKRNGFSDIYKVFDDNMYNKEMFKIVNKALTGE